MNFEEVKEIEIPNYILKMKKLGYSIIGVEQTEYSISIENFNFPEKIILLLGIFYYKILFR
jgi:hypothetical protein